MSETTQRYLGYEASYSAGHMYMHMHLGRPRKRIIDREAPTTHR